FERAPANVDAGRQDELVVVERLAGRERDGARGAVDVLGEGAGDRDAEARQLVIAVADRFEIDEAAEIEVGERAGIEPLRRLDQRDAEFGAEALQIFRSRGAAEAAADNDDVAGRGARDVRHGDAGENAGAEETKG